MKFRRVLLREEIQQGQRLKFGWGIAYRDMMTDTAICYPLGIHWVVRLYKDFTFFVWKLHVPGWDLNYESEINAIKDKVWEDARKTFTSQNRKENELWFHAGQLVSETRKMVENLEAFKKIENH